MVAMLAVDPGEEHCGLAVFVDGECRWTGEKKPQDLYDWMGAYAAVYSRDRLKWDVLVVEEFRLYPKHAAAQAWSKFGTVEVIGVLKEWCRREEVELVMQPASIKKSTVAILRSHGKKMRSHGSGAHARDAELHGWHYILKQRQGEQRKGEDSDGDR